MKTDCHNHVLPEEAVELLRRDGAYGAKVDGDLITGRGHSDFRNGLTLLPTFHDPTAKLADLDARGMDAAIVSVTPPAFYYDVAGPAGELMCEVVNDGLARFCDHDPSRLRWYAHVPMQDPGRAKGMLAEAMAAGAVGVEVGTNVAGARLDTPIFADFWRAAEELGAVVQIHPAYNEPHPGLADWYLQNSIGNLLETTIAIERLICAGVLDRHPDLSILLVHAGGFVPYQLGRLRHTTEVRKELEGIGDPWARLGNVWFDTITHDEQALAYLVSRVGLDRVVLGTDLPFDMAPDRPVGQIERALGADAAAHVMEDGPSRLFAQAS